MPLKETTNLQSLTPDQNLYPNAETRKNYNHLIIIETNANHQHQEEELHN